MSSLKRCRKVDSHSWHSLKRFFARAIMSFLRSALAAPYDPIQLPGVYPPITR